MRSSQSSLCGPGIIQGEVSLKLYYNCRTGAMEVTVDAVKNLIEVNGDRPNPYVKVLLHPADGANEKKRKTKAKRKCVDAVFKEVLKVQTRQIRSKHNGMCTNVYSSPG